MVVWLGVKAFQRLIWLIAHVHRWLREAEERSAA